MDPSKRSTLRWMAAAAGASLLSSVADAAPAGPAFDRAALIANARKEGRLVWYTGAPQTLATAMLKAFNQKYPFIDVSDYFRQSAGRLQGRLMAEAAAGKKVADVFHSGDITQFSDLERLFVPFETPEQQAYPATLQKKGIWTAWRVTALDLSYNPSILPGAGAPKSWADLADPRYKGKIGLQDATAGLMFVQWFILKEKLGADFWRKIGANKPVLFSGNVPIAEAMLRGEILVCANSPSYIDYQYEVRDGAPYKHVNPTEGVPLALNGISVLKDAPHPNAARLFVDWILSKEGQQIMVKEQGDYSGRSDVAPATGMTPLASLKTLTPSSLDALNQSKAEFAAQWAAFGKSS